MLIDAQLLPSGVELRADVVVVGAGPAGLTVTRALAASGIHVMLLEGAGRTHSRGDDDALAGVGSGVPFPLVRSRHRGFGGTSTHWTPTTGLRVRPLDEIDFSARPGRPHDAWPFGADSLQRYYERAHQLIGLEHGYSPGRWYGSETPTPLAWRGGPELAMFQFADHECFVKTYDNVIADPKIDLVLHARVDEVELRVGAQEVRRLAVVGPDGNRFTVMAPTFVMACGAIENSRLLLASPGRSGQGVGNEHDNVGRYFMDHLSIDTGVIEPLSGRIIDDEVFCGGGSPADRHQPMLWLGSDTIAREGLPNAAFWVEETDDNYLSAGVSSARNLRLAFHSSPRRNLAKHTLKTVRGSVDVVRFGLRNVRRSTKGRILAMRILTEQLPDRESRVRLSRRRDALGIQRVDVDWRVSAADLDVVDAHQQLIGRLLEERGVARLTHRFDRDAHPGPMMSNYHHLGGTRMHVDPRRGVVDADCRVHSAPNLYVIGGSSFPTGGYVNPTLTIMALALKAAEAIARQQRPVAVGSRQADTAGAVSNGHEAAVKSRYRQTSTDIGR